MKKIPRVVRADSINHDRLIQALHDVDQFIPAKADEKWLSLLRMIPVNLRSALLVELKLGNHVADISYCDWPHKGSVAIGLKSPFKNEWASNTLGVEYYFMNDPHYWKAHINQTVNGIQHLIFTPFE